MDKETSCNYCQKSLIVPYSWVDRLLKKYLAKYDKNNYDAKTLDIIKMFVKMCPIIKSYIYHEYSDLFQCLDLSFFVRMDHEAKYFLRTAYLHDRSGAMESTGIICDFCGFSSCDFHLFYGGFIFGKCIEKDCDNRFSICGWCQEKVEASLINRCMICYVTNIKKHTKSKQIDKNYIINNTNF